MQVEFRDEVIPAGTSLYRFVNCKSYGLIIAGMTENKEKQGRFNHNQNVYYCSKSLESLLCEMQSQKICGFLIKSTVVAPLTCAFPDNTFASIVLRGRVGEKEQVHRILDLCGLDMMISYDITSKLFDKLTKVYTDGVIYPSAHGIDTIIGKTIFQLTPETGFGNIALTETGYGKIKEDKPVVYWH